MIEILVNLQEVIWTGARRRERMVSVCFCLHLDLCEMRLFRHMSLTHFLSICLSGYLSADPQLIDPVPYTISARGVTLSLRTNTKHLCF